MKAYKTLSATARNALDNWESTGWIRGDLQQQFTAGHGPLVDELTAAFEPVRQYLKSAHPSGTIMLYRGLYRADDDEFQQSTGYQYDARKTNVLTSWTSEKKSAEIFAGIRSAAKKHRSFLTQSHNQKEIDDAVDRFEKTGFARYRNYRFKISKTDPKYFDIYDDYIGYLTDGYTKDFRRDLEQKKLEIDQDNDQKMALATILHQPVSIDKIVWISNKLNNKEFIVRK